MKHVFKHFTRGYAKDGDSNDLPADALIEAMNVDLDLGVGEVRVRPGMERYAQIGNLPVGSTGYAGVTSPPNGGTWQLVDWILWDSGITTVQHNTMVIYRERNAADTGYEDTWIVFSDAMTGGEGQSFLQLLGSGMPSTSNEYFTAPVFRPVAFNGMVFIAMGPGLDGMVLCNLCEEGDRTYPTMTITQSTYPATQLKFGEGGHIYGGWLWDFWKLYWSAPLTAGAAYEISHVPTYFNLQLEDAATSGRVPLEKCSYVFAICPGYDDFEQQYGVPMYITLDKSVWASGVDRVAKFTLSFSAGANSYNKRIDHFAIYGMKRDRTDRLDDNGLSRLRTVPFRATGTTALALASGNVDVYIDDNIFKNIEGTWAADAKGRPVTLHASEIGVISSFSTNYAYLRPKTDYVDDEITVKASGFALRRKRLYAWGINHDPGQSRFAISALDTNTSGQVNVFWKLNRIWRDGSRQTTWALMWYDRLFLFNRHNSYWIDLEQRLDDQSMELDTGFGMGTDIVRTIAKGGEALFWANQHSVFRFTDGVPQDLLETLWRDEWLGITRARRADAVGGYCAYRAEYWLSVQTDDNVWTVYVWDDIRRNWRRYRFMYDGTSTDFAPRGFVNDSLGQWVVYGRNLVTNYETALLFDDGAKLDEGAAITFELSPQWTGERDTEMIVHRLDLQRASDDEMQVRIYRDRVAAASATLTFSSDRSHMVNVPAMRCYEYRLSVTGTYSNASRRVPRIQQITIETKDDTKRSR